jgi:tetratricopeptide (TPR) repeat protein
VLSNLGQVHRDQGRFDEARAHFEAALATLREVGLKRYEGAVLGSLGRLHCEQGRIEEARAALAAGEPILREIGPVPELATLRELIAARS